MRRTVLALSAVAVVGGMALPSYAQPQLPVGVQVDTKDGVVVTTTVGGNPGTYTGVRDGKACVVVSQQVPKCVDLGVVR